MQMTAAVSTEDVLKSIGHMTFDDLERVKEAIVERDLYFIEFRKDEPGNIVGDFKAEGYSAGFLKDLEDGLKKSSVYNDDQTP